MDSLLELKEKIDTFTRERDWEQFHTPANLAKSISIEANELLECFQWSDTEYDLGAVREELADVVNYCIQMASVLDLDLREIVLAKMEKNAAKYPVSKAKGSAAKYDKLAQLTEQQETLTETSAPVPLGPAAPAPEEAASIERFFDTPGRVTEADVRRSTERYRNGNRIYLVVEENGKECCYLRGPDLASWLPYDIMDLWDKLDWNEEAYEPVSPEEVLETVGEWEQVLKAAVNGTPLT